jgi:hypothetical protein
MEVVPVDREISKLNRVAINVALLSLARRNIDDQALPFGQWFDGVHFGYPL